MSAAAGLENASMVKRPVRVREQKGQSSLGSGGALPQNQKTVALFPNKSGIVAE